ncbi:MAG TPA: TolC family protein [Planctomycetota bacterium]|nr:TolC family protein [Planctomycetota bacterium]
MIRRLHAPLLAALALAAPGCKVDQAAEVATYRSVLDERGPGPVERLVPREPLPIARALALANQENERLSIAGEDYLQAIIEKRRVASQFRPTISLVPSFFARDPVPNAPGESHGNHALDVPASAGYSSFNGIRSAADLRKAGLTAEQQRCLLLDFQTSLMLDVAQTYYVVMQSERQVEVLADSVAVQLERVRDLEAQQAVGRARPLDVAQARAQWASSVAQLAAARSDVATGRSVLAFLIGVPSVDGPLTDGLELPTVGTEEPFRDRALTGREDLLAAHEAVDAAREGVRAAVAEYYPSLSLDFDLFLYKETIPSSSIYTFFVSLNIPIFRGGSIRADVRTAWSRYRQAKLEESQLARQVARDVSVAYTLLQTSTEQIGNLRTQVDAAQEAFDQAQSLVGAGRATNLERLVAQQQLLSAQLELASEEFNRRVAYLSLRRATGELVPDLARLSG